MNIEAYLKPETAIERQIMQDVDWVKGALWGKPRRGHPEGKVVYHIRDVLDNVDKVKATDKMREQLRLIAIVHDAFKYKEGHGWPRDWSQHHAFLAKQFSEKYIKDEAVLLVTQWHDEAYYCWKMRYKYFRKSASEKRLATLLDLLGKNRQLYYLFFKCDTQIGGKTQAPVAWFEETIPKIDIVNF